MAQPHINLRLSQFFLCVKLLLFSLKSAPTFSSCSGSAFLLQSSDHRSRPNGDKGGVKSPRSKGHLSERQWGTLDLSDTHQMPWGWNTASGMTAVLKALASWGSHCRLHTRSEFRICLKAVALIAATISSVLNHAHSMIDQSIAWWLQCFSYRFVGSRVQKTLKLEHSQWSSAIHQLYISYGIVKFLAGSLPTEDRLWLWLRPGDSLILVPIWVLSSPLFIECPTVPIRFQFAFKTGLSVRSCPAFLTNRCLVIRVRVPPVVVVICMWIKSAKILMFIMLTPYIAVDDVLALCQGSPSLLLTAHRDVFWRRRHSLPAPEANPLHPLLHRHLNLHLPQPIRSVFVSLKRIAMKHYTNCAWVTRSTVDGWKWYCEI